MSKVYIVSIVYILENLKERSRVYSIYCKQNLNAGLLQQHHFWAGLMAIFRVAVLLFIKPKLE